MGDDTIRGDLANHRLTCEHPIAACITCRAWAELDRCAGDVDAVRFEAEAARSRLAMFLTLYRQANSQLRYAAEQLLAGDGALSGSGEDLPRVPDAVFEKIQSAAERATELRYVQRQLAIALARLERFRSVHAQHAARARLPEVSREMRASAYAIAELLAEAWHGPGWSGQPLDPLDEPSVQLVPAENGAAHA